MKAGVRFGDQIIYIEMTDPMGRTEVRATVIGEKETREYPFLVDTGATYLALPIEKIEALGLPRGPGKLRLMSATGFVEVNTYFAGGALVER